VAAAAWAAWISDPASPHVKEQGKGGFGRPFSWAKAATAKSAESAKLRSAQPKKTFPRRLAAKIT
jgi:hypothetical protein